MKDYENEIQYKGKTYRLVFNLNVMEAIQEEFGTVEHWGELSDGSTGEPSARAVIFGLMEMINEGIDIDTEENGTDTPFVSLKQTGRIVSELGFAEATQTLNDTVIEATMSDEKNE